MIPVESDQVEHFTPDSLANVLPKIDFRFRATTKRDAMRYSHQLNLEGLRLWDDETVRAAILRVLKSQWDEETFEREQQRLATAWAKIDQEMDLDPDEGAALAELTTRCMDVDPLLRRMDADNKRFAQEAPAIALSIFLCGWKNLDTPFRVEGGVIPMDTMQQLSRDLRKVEEEAQESKVEGINPGMAWLQLSLKAFSLMSLDKEEQKNSSAPSPSSDSPNGSNTTTPPGGASETTTSNPAKTPARSSAKKRKS